MDGPSAQLHAQILYLTCGTRQHPDRADSGGSGLPLLPSRCKPDPAHSSGLVHQHSGNVCGHRRHHSKVGADPLWSPHNRAGRAAWEVMSFLSHKHWHKQKLEGPWREGQRDAEQGKARIHKVLLRPLLT